MIVVHQNSDHRIIGLASALKYVGEQVIYWDSKTVPACDMIKLQKPSLIIVAEKNIGSDLFYATKKYGVPIIVFGLVQDSSIVLNCVDYDINTKILSNLDRYYQIDIAADYARFNSSDIAQKRGIFCVYPSKPITTKDFSLINRLSTIKDIPLRIVSNSSIPSQFYIGLAQDREIKREIIASKFYIDFYNHFYDAALLKTIPLSTHRSDFYLQINDDNICDVINKVNNEERLYKSLVKKTRRHTLEHHTYFHRLRDIALKLDNKDLETKCQKTLQSIVEHS